MWGCPTRTARRTWVATKPVSKAPAPAERVEVAELAATGARGLLAARAATLEPVRGWAGAAWGEPLERLVPRVLADPVSLGRWRAERDLAVPARAQSRAVAPARR